MTDINLTLDEMKAIAILYRDANLVHASGEMTRVLFADDASIEYHVTYAGRTLDLNVNVEEMMEHLESGQYKNTTTSKVLAETFEVAGPNTLCYQGKVETTRLGNGLIEEAGEATYIIDSVMTVGFKVVSGRILISSLKNVYTKSLKQ